MIIYIDFNNTKPNLNRQYVTLYTTSSKEICLCSHAVLARQNSIRDGQMTTDQSCCCQMLLISSVYSFPSERQRLKNMTRRNFKFKSSRIQAESSALNVRERIVACPADLVGFSYTT